MLHPLHAASNAYFFVTVSKLEKKRVWHDLTAPADCHGWRGAFRENF
jgi:hypothetical protein